MLHQQKFKAFVAAKIAFIALKLGVCFTSVLRQYRGGEFYPAV